MLGNNFFLLFLSKSRKNLGRGNKKKNGVPASGFTGRVKGSSWMSGKSAVVGFALQNLTSFSKSKTKVLVSEELLQLFKLSRLNLAKPVFQLNNFFFLEKRIAQERDFEYVWSPEEREF